MKKHLKLGFIFLCFCVLFSNFSLCSEESLFTPEIANSPLVQKLFSFLEKSAGDAELKGHIKYMKPSTAQSAGPYRESKVEMKLEQVTLKQLVDYLYRIESPEKLISIKRISIKENKGESGYIDAVLQVLTFQ